MSLVIFSVTIIFMVASLLFIPTIKINNYKLETNWVIVLVGALILLITKSINLNTLYLSLTNTNGINPLKLITLFISMTLLSLFLDEIGFFKWLALYLVIRVKGKQIYLFIALYLLVSILTVFTSNDVIILTFTPFICYFTKAAKIKPLPYLFGILTAANTWSIILIIGNPTNIYLAINQNIDFISYLKVMWLPGIIAGISGLFMVYLLFRKNLKEEMENITEEEKLQDPFLVIIGLIVIISTIVLLSLASFINLEMWTITLFMAISLILIAIIYLKIKKKSLTPIYITIKKAPWNFIPLILGLFVLLEGIKQSGFIDIFSNILNKGNPIFNYGFSSYLVSNLMNNQPMSMLYSAILETTPRNIIKAATYASIIGSNLGVLLTPLGALAGLMWMNLLKEQNINLSFFGYIKRAFLIGIVCMILTLLALSITI